MCRSDSAADTRDSENTFPASLADERNAARGGGDGKKQKRDGEEERK